MLQDIHANALRKFILQTLLPIVAQVADDDTADREEYAEEKPEAQTIGITIALLNTSNDGIDQPTPSQGNRGGQQTFEQRRCQKAKEQARLRCPGHAPNPNQGRSNICDLHAGESSFCNWLRSTLPVAVVGKCERNTMVCGTM